MRAVTAIDRFCETYIPCSGRERGDWLDARATDERMMSRMYNTLVHATDFLPWTYLDFCRERLVAVWVQHDFNQPMPEFLKLISYERGKSCALLNEEQRAYIEIKMQHAICELADACNYALEFNDECPAPCRGDISQPFGCEQQPGHCFGEVAHDVE